MSGYFILFLLVLAALAIIAVAYVRTTNRRIAALVAERDRLYSTQRMDPRFLQHLMARMREAKR